MNNEPTTVIPTTSYPAWRRFLISATRVFFVGFAIQFAQGILVLKEWGDLTGKFLLGLLVGAISAGLYSLVKWINERDAGLI